MLFLVYLNECLVSPDSCIVALTFLISSESPWLGIMMGGGAGVLLFLVLDWASSCCSSNSIVGIGIFSKESTGWIRDYVDAIMSSSRTFFCSYNFWSNFTLVS